MSRDKLRELSTGAERLTQIPVVCGPVCLCRSVDFTVSAPWFHNDIVNPTWMGFNKATMGTRLASPDGSGVRGRGSYAQQHCLLCPGFPL